MRKVDPAGYVEVLNERWLVGPQWSLILSHKRQNL
jgi:hypothetical protein